MRLCQDSGFRVHFPVFGFQFPVSGVQTSGFRLLLFPAVFFALEAISQMNRESMQSAPSGAKAGVLIGPERHD